MIIVCPECGVVFHIETSNSFKYSEEELQLKKRQGIIAVCPNGCYLTQSEVDTAIKVKGEK